LHRLALPGNTGSAEPGTATECPPDPPIIPGGRGGPRRHTLPVCFRGGVFRVLSRTGGPPPTRSACLR
jgi:hypothetical protein